MKSPISLRFGAIAAGTLFVAPISCNSILTKSAPLNTSDKPYEYVEVLGSNIPQRVVKGQQPMIASPTSTISAEAWREQMEKAQGRVGTGR